MNKYKSFFFLYRVIIQQGNMKDERRPSFVMRLDYISGII